MVVEARLWMELSMVVGLLSVVNVLETSVDRDLGNSTIATSSEGVWFFNNLETLCYRAALLILIPSAAKKVIASS